MKPVDHYEKRLRDRLAELETRLTRIERNLDAPRSKDDDERAIEQENDEVLEHLGDAGLAEIRMIQEALHRVEKGLFGLCVVCEEPISEARLDLLPHTPRCRNCA